MFLQWTVLFLFHVQDGFFFLYYAPKVIRQIVIAPKTDTTFRFHYA